ncbi:MAG: chemotaxis protein CheW [Planctomycetota bacterium]
MTDGSKNHAVADVPQGNTEEEIRQFIGIRFGTELYGIPIEKTREITKPLQITGIPGTLPHVKGLMNLHGEILCVVDVKILLNMGKIQMTEKGRIVVVKTREGLVGIFCDEVADIYDVLTKDIEPPLSTLSKEMDVSMKGQTQTRDGLMGILDIEKLLLTQEKSL